MHLGLYLDKTLPPVPLDNELSRVASPSDDELYRDKKKKRTLSRLLSKLNLLGVDNRKEFKLGSISSPPQANGFGPPVDSMYDSEPLEPPVPLYFARAHTSRRSSMQSSSPSLQMQSASGTLPSLSPAASQVDLTSIRSSLNTVPSPVSGRNGQLLQADIWTLPANGAHGAEEMIKSEVLEYVEPSTLQKAAKLRREKSLPALPLEPIGFEGGSPYASSTHAVARSYANDPYGHPPLDSIDGGRKSKARSGARGFSVWSMPFRRSSKDDYASFDYAPREQTLGTIVRDQGFVAYRYPSLEAGS